MKLLWVTYFILNINAAIDTGKYQDISAHPPPVVATVAAALSGIASEILA